MKSKAAGCGSISTVFPSIILPCVSSIIIMIIIIMIIIIMIIMIMIIATTIVTTKIKIRHLKNVLFEPLLKENKSTLPANQMKNRSFSNLAVIIIANAQGINVSRLFEEVFIE